MRWIRLIVLRSSAGSRSTVTTGPSTAGELTTADDVGRTVAAAPAEACALGGRSALGTLVGGTSGIRSVGARGVTDSLVGRATAGGSDGEGRLSCSGEAAAATMAGPTVLEGIGAIVALRGLSVGSGVSEPADAGVDASSGSGARRWSTAGLRPSAGRDVGMAEAPLWAVPSGVAGTSARVVTETHEVTTAVARTRATKERPT
jgi:hypothetical protein